MKTLDRKTRKRASKRAETPKVRFESQDNFSALFAANSAQHPTSPGLQSNRQILNKLNISRAISRSNTAQTDEDIPNSVSRLARSSFTKTLSRSSYTGDNASVYSSQPFLASPFQRSESAISFSLSENPNMQRSMTARRGFISRLFTSRNEGLQNRKDGSMSTIGSLGNALTPVERTQKKGFLRNASLRVKSILHRPTRGTLTEMKVDDNNQNGWRMQGQSMASIDMYPHSVTSFAMSEVPLNNGVQPHESPVREPPVKRGMRQVFTTLARDRKKIVIQNKQNYHMISASHVFDAADSTKIHTQDLSFSNEGVHFRDTLLEEDLAPRKTTDELIESRNELKKTMETNNSRLKRTVNGTDIDNEKAKFIKGLRSRNRPTTVSDTTSDAEYSRFRLRETLDDGSKNRSPSEDDEADFLEPFHEMVNENAEDIIQSQKSSDLEDFEWDDDFMEELSFGEESDFRASFSVLSEGGPSSGAVGTMYPLSRREPAMSFVTIASKKTTQQYFVRKPKKNTKKKFEFRKNSQEPVNQAVARQLIENMQLADSNAPLNIKKLDSGNTVRETFNSVVFDQQRSTNMSRSKNTGNDESMDNFGSTMFSETSDLDIFEALGEEEVNATLKRMQGAVQKSRMVINAVAKVVKRPEKKYAFKEVIGTGTFGEVRCAQNLKSLELEAIKICSLKTVQNILDAAKELTFLSVLTQCPFVIQYLSSIQTKRSELWIATEFCDIGDLTTLMDVCKMTLRKTELKIVLSCVALGLDYIHEKQIIHRDIKASNILVSSTGLVKIADFGVSKRTHDNEMREMTMVGSPYWIAPEVIKGDHVYNNKADMWSLGIMVIELLQGNPPFISYEQNKVLNKILVAKQEDRLVGLDDCQGYDYFLEQILDDLLETDVEDRHSAKELVETENPYLKETLYDIQFLRKQNAFYSDDDRNTAIQVIKIGNHDTAAEKAIEKAIFRSLKPMKDLVEGNIEKIKEHRAKHNFGVKAWARKAKNV